MSLFSLSFCSPAVVLSMTILISDISFFKLMILLFNEFTASNCSSIFKSFFLILSLLSFSLLMTTFIFSSISTSLLSLSPLSLIISFSLSSNFSFCCTWISSNSFSLAFSFNSMHFRISSDVFSFNSMLFRISSDVAVLNKCCCS